MARASQRPSTRATKARRPRRSTGARRAPPSAAVRDEEAGLDACELERFESAATPDADLPAAKGGVAVPGLRRGRTLSTSAPPTAGGRDTAYSLSWLPTVLLDAGLKVAEQPGWRTRGRGDVGTVLGVVCHHTVGLPTGIMPSLGLLTGGTPTLAGPLCQLGLGRDGTFFVIAAGRANHAGTGNWQGIATGNTSFIGIEAENTGHVTGPLADPWPDVQLDAYRRGCAAILKKIQADALLCCGHREYALPQGRKIDPTFDMNAFRTQVAAVMAGTAPAPSVIPAVDGANRPTLRRGDSGEPVKEVQARVGVPTSGSFDGSTEAAVRQFQRDHGLTPDGIVGPRTWATIAAG